MLAIAVLAILFVLFILLISIPVDFRFRFDSSQCPSFGLQIGWLFSLVKIQISDKAKKPLRLKKPRKKKAKNGVSKIQFSKLVTRSLMLRLLRLAKDIFNCFRFKLIDVDIRAGMGVPSDTGMIFGYISAVFPIFTASVQGRIRITPDFSDEPVLEGSSAGIVRLWPLEIIFVILTFVFSRPVLQTIRSAILQWSNRR